MTLDEIQVYLTVEVYHSHWTSEFPSRVVPVHYHHSVIQHLLIGRKLISDVNNWKLSRISHYSSWNYKFHSRSYRARRIHPLDWQKLYQFLMGRYSNHTFKRKATHVFYFAFQLLLSIFDISLFDRRVAMSVLQKNSG